MKTAKNLYPQICQFENLLLAAKKAQKGKRFQDNVAQFNFHLESNLFQLQKELHDQSYQPGEYKEFHILEPKPRMISAAPYRDRVVHHALCNIINPVLEGSMIFDSYANRKGKGTHKAILRYQAFCKKNKYLQIKEENIYGNQSIKKGNCQHLGFSGAVPGTTIQGTAG